MRSACPEKVLSGCPASSKVLAAASGSLEKHQWILLTEGDPSTKPGGPPNLRFDPAGCRVAGFTGCNRFVGAYEFDGSRLVFSRLAQTRKHCADRATLERVFLDALGRTRRAILTDGHLELLDEADRPLLEFYAHNQA